QFVMTLVGEAACKHPPAETLLSTHKWQGVIDPVDMLLFASTFLRDRDLPVIQKRLTASVIASLALFDPLVVERLVDKSLDSIHNPEPVLESIAQERKWSKNMAPQWSSGTSDYLDGQVRLHSAFCVVKERKNEIQRRIWSAQMGIIFP